MATCGHGRTGAARRRGRCSLPRRPPALSSGCADGHSTQNDRRRAGRGSLSQRRTTAEGLDEILSLYAQCPAAVSRTAEVADRCTFSLDELRYEYPEELCPAGETPSSYLARLTWAGAQERYPAGVPTKVSQLIERELAIIEELNYAAYFLTVWDLVRFARAVGILCQGRGSAANSAVCYCLGVTAVDPDRIDVLFERFISKDRDEAPDIDIDFEHQRREEVIQYIYEKYGRERVRHDGRADHLSAAFGRARRRQGPRLVARPGRCAGQCDRSCH